MPQESIVIIFSRIAANFAYREAYREASLLSTIREECRRNDKMRAIYANTRTLHIFSAAAKRRLASFLISNLFKIHTCYLRVLTRASNLNEISFQARRMRNYGFQKHLTKAIQVTDVTTYPLASFPPEKFSWFRCNLKPDTFIYV